MLLETVRSALQRRGYDVSDAEPASAPGDRTDRWRPPDVYAEGDDALACWVVDRVQPSTVIRAQAAARQMAARPLLAGPAVDDGARPWADRYDVEVLDTDAVDAPTTNGTNGVNGTRGTSGTADEAPSEDQGSPEPERPAWGMAPGTPAPDAAEAEPDEAAEASGVLDVLDLPDDEAPDAEPEADEADPPDPPPWMAARPGPSATASEDTEAEDPPDPVDGDGVPTPATGEAQSDETEKVDGVDEAGDLPWDPADADPPETASASGDAAVDPPGEPLADDSDTEEPSEVADPATREEPAPVAAAPATNGGSTQAEADVDPADGATPERSGGPGGTSLDALVEAAAQSPHPATGGTASDGSSPEPSDADVEKGAVTPPGSTPPQEQSGSGTGFDETHTTASTDPEKIAEDVMREVEAETNGAGEATEAAHDGPDEPEPGSTPDQPETASPEPARDGNGADPGRNGDGATPNQNGNEASPGPNGNGAGHGQASREPEPAAQPAANGNGAARDEAKPGDDGGLQDDGSKLVGDDDAAMRIHDPELWETSGRLDDVRTSLRGDADSPHDRARKRSADSSWLDDLDE